MYVTTNKHNKDKHVDVNKNNQILFSIFFNTRLAIDEMEKPMVPEKHPKMMNSNISSILVSLYMMVTISNQYILIKK